MYFKIYFIYLLNFCIMKNYDKLNKSYYYISVILYKLEK